MTEPLILITAGHDAREVGSTQADGGKEYTYTLPLAQEVRDALLAGWQCRVQLTRETDAPLTQGGDLGAELYARANMANTLGAQFYLSLHHDAGPQAARGGSLYVHTNRRAPDGGLVWLPAVDPNTGAVNHTAPRSYEMAQLGMPIVKDALAELGIPWRGGIMCCDFAELRYPDCPCWLLESHFGTNPEDDRIMDQPGNRRQLAREIARAVATAMKLAPVLKAEQSGFPRVPIDLLNGQVVMGELRGQVTWMPVGREDWRPVREVAAAVGAVVVPVAFDDPARRRVRITAPEPQPRPAQVPGDIRPV